jgi:hypothetical protein
MVKGFFRKGGAPLGERVASMLQMLKQVFAIQDQTRTQNDPLVRTRQVLVQKDARRLADIEATIQSELQQIVATALRSEGMTS